MKKDKLFELAVKIMPALVWKGGKDSLWPIDSDKASVAVASAVIWTMVGACPVWPKNFFDVVGQDKVYFDASYANLELAAKENILDSDFMAAMLYLFEPRTVGDIRDPGIKTRFAQSWGFGGRAYPDYHYGNDCHIRRRVLEAGKKHYDELPQNIRNAIDTVALHIPPMLEKVLM